MKDLFKFSSKKQSAEKNEPTTSELVAEIHETFYTEVDRLLEEAKIELPENTDKQYLLEKSRRLKQLGFVLTSEVKEANLEEVRLNGIKYENDKKRELVEAIKYFSQKYPYYKFITEESVQKICSKYGLIYGAVDRFIGTVPEENLKHIESFKIDDKDNCYEIRYVGNLESVMYINYDDFKIETRQVDGLEAHFFNPFIRDRTKIARKCELEIAAPKDDFNTNGMELRGFNLTEKFVPDPIVLQPVYFKKQKHYLIVTAWGDEASDSLVVNERMN